MHILRYRSILLRFLYIPCCLLCFTACIDILHFVEIQADGSMKISFRVSVIKPDEDSAREIPSPEKLMAQKKGILANASIHKIEGPDYQGFQMKITRRAPDLKSAEPSEFQNIVPYQDKEDQLYYIFTGASGKKNGTKKKTDFDNPQMNKMFKALFSSAKYKLFIKGYYTPAGAVFITAKGETIPLVVEKFADGYLLDLPLFLLARKGALIVSKQVVPDASLVREKLKVWFPAPPSKSEDPTKKTI